MNDVNTERPMITETADAELIRRKLADRIAEAKASWLPISGHVVNITFTLNEREIIISALTQNTAARLSELSRTEAERDALAIRVADMERREERMREALERSVVAIDDWLHSYAPAFCDPKRVEEAKARVASVGTLYYIGIVQRDNRAALTPDQNGRGE